MNAPDPRPARFEANRAQAYDDTIARALPGYALIHDMAAVLMKVLLPAGARVLVIGAGTGTDILRLGQDNPGWRFLGVDPSPDMLAVARQRVATVPGLEERVDWHAGALDTLAADTPAHDGALSVLVSHFLPDTPSGKAALLGHAARFLRPGAPLMLADFLPPGPDLPDAALMEAAWVAWQRERGIEDDAIMRGLSHARRAIHPIGPERLGALLTDAGFTPPVRVMQALHVHGWLTRKREDA
ncbi:class I SAM-dependent methyltransferase [Pararhodospirillum oryzae]|uniref:Methyltransferase type 12 domain-containing protein n=1 Tax=Pararhodospirillum oryzae TaxID=478448 RepID=A0A512H659_9PROT|nr:class I SAM-dependent methyltransferase [Pararhodospirillum oryzae]GEO80921.1 hypothetical protein ROR02_10520 [Pararhodospirillum oryzae]